MEFDTIRCLTATRLLIDAVMNTDAVKDTISWPVLYSQQCRLLRCSDQGPRSVVVRRDKRGFGFILRGAKCKLQFLLVLIIINIIILFCCTMVLLLMTGQS